MSEPDKWLKGVLGNLQSVVADAQASTAGIVGQFQAPRAASDVVKHLATIKPQIEAIHQDARRFLEEQVAPAVLKYGSTVDYVRGVIERSLPTIVETLQSMFPPLDHAPGHEERKKAVQAISEKVEAVIVVILVAFRVDADLVRKHCGEVKSHLESVFVAIGDLTEQHQDKAMIAVLLLQVLLPAIWTTQLLPLLQTSIAGRARARL